MAKVDTSSIRNLAIVGHGGAGKTLLSEAMLMEAGLATRIPAGIIDYATDEKDRGHSIDSAFAQFSWEETQFTLIDNPGYQDFVNNSHSSLSVVETSVLVVSAADGVTVNTRRMWDLSRKNNLASLIVITKLDGENVTFEDTVSKIQEYCGDNCIPLVVPNGVGSHLTEVSDIFFDQTDSEHRERLIEAVVETNDEMMEKYLEGEEIPQDQLTEQLKKAVHTGKIFPIITVVPTKNIGVKKLMELMVKLAPSPCDVDAREAEEDGNKVTCKTSIDAPFVGQVFKVFNDPFGRLSYFKVVSGILKSSSSIYITNTETTERIGNIIKTIGKEQTHVDEAVAGEIVAVAKVENIQVGHTLATDKAKTIFPTITFPRPMVQLSVQPLSRGDEQKISSALIKLTEEDPTFLVNRHEETAEQIVEGMSTLHLDIMLNRLKMRFKVESSTKLPKIPYRETIQGKADTRYRHKKQSGGSGQFGEVAIKMSPAERGVGFEFVNRIVGGVISSQYIASTEKGIKMKMEKGILAGYPIVDIKAELYDGKTHDVDSSDAAFQMAGSKAFQEGFGKAKPVLLEPVLNIQITIPSQFMGDIMGDLNSRRGRIMGSDSEGNDQTVEAQVPLAEIMTYSTDLKAITGGEGTYTTDFSHYDVVPSHLQDKIIAKAKEEQEN